MVSQIQDDNPLEPIMKSVKFCPLNKQIILNCVLCQSRLYGVVLPTCGSHVNINVFCIKLTLFLEHVLKYLDTALNVMLSFLILCC